MKKTTAAIVQARMGSNRLPGKVLKNLSGQPVLYHIIKRVEQVPGIDKIIVATTEEEIDNSIENYVNSIGINCFRGSSDNVLDRFYQAATSFSVDVIIRLTADNPLVDAKVLEQLLSYFSRCNCEYASTGGYPLGLGAEVFTFDALATAHKNASLPYEKEHVTPYMYREGQTVGRLVAPVDQSTLRFTMDTPEDYAFIQCVYDSLYHGSHDFYLDDILALLSKHPDMIRINAHVHQKKLGE